MNALSAAPALSLHERLQTDALVGPFSKTCDPNLVEAIGRSGMDFIILDLEHGPNDIVNLGNLIRAAELSGLAAVVRTLRLDQIGRALDLGATAVQIPHVSTSEDARAAVRTARFSPDGQRGVCRYVRAAAHGTTEKQRYFREANRVTLIAQVEGKAGLTDLPEIIAVPGIDVVFLGVYDLSQSLGIVGQTDHPDVIAALTQVIAQCRQRRIPVGTFVESVETARRYRALGVNYLCYSVDVGLIGDACRHVATQVKAT